MALISTADADTDDETMRIQVAVHATTHPELFAQLHKLPRRRRADRIRQLALLGIGGAGGARVAGTVQQDAPATAPEAVPVPRRQLGLLAFPD